MDTRHRLQEALAERYRIERQLGEGGMAVVYLAEDLKHHRPVAIKVLRPELGAVLGSERFLREIEVVARLNHPNILGLHDSGEADGLLYFVMPYVEGESLRARLEREPRLPLDQAIHITREVGDALAYAHGQGLIHRDIKPENILFQAGHALVCDFGIAQVASEAREHLTRTGVAVGTIAYMSPEQLAGEGAVDGRTDVYSLGCMLHEMLAGEVPFAGATPQIALAQKLTGQSTDLNQMRADVPPTVQQVLTRALAVDVGDRYATAEAFTGALEHATTAAVVEGDARRRRRRRLVRSVVGGTGLTLAGAAVWWLSTLLGGPAMQRIAVLPFSNQRADSTQAFYVQGVYQDLLLELAKAGLRVINSSSVARYAGTNTPVKEIARELQVDGVVEGTASIGADQIEIQLQLVDGRSEEIRWTESFQANPRYVVTLYHQAARAIAEQTGSQLSAEVLERLAEARPVDPAVHEALLQARFNYEKLTAAGLETAMSYYELVLERDSLSAEAWMGIGRVWTARAQMGLLSGTEARRLGDAALARAAAIDPSLSQVQAELAGRLTWVEWNWQAALEAFQRALSADPTNSRTRGSYAHLLLYMKRDAEALEQARQAAQLDPFNTVVQGFYGMTLNFLHRYRDAAAVLEPVRARDPGAPIVLSTLRTTYHLLGRRDEAMRMWRASYESDPEELAALDSGYRAGGYSAGLRAVGDLMVERYRQDTAYVRPWQIGTLYVRAGQDSLAIPWLERAMAEHDQNMPYISVDPIFDSMRDEPRFQALMDRLGLPR